MAKKKPHKDAEDGLDGLLQSTGTVAELWQNVQTVLRAGKRPIVWGPPGTGKTRGLEARALATWADKGILFETMIGSLSEPEDVNGFPVEGAPVRDARGHEIPVVSFAPRDMFVRLNRHGGILFLDELSTTGPRTMKALLRGINDGVFGDYALDMTRVGILAAANRPAEGVDADDLPPPSANRLVHFSWPTGPEACKEFCQNFPGYWGNPPKVEFLGEVLPEEIYARVRALISGFLYTRPHVFFALPKSANGIDPVQAGLAWTSPRSWDSAAACLARAMADGRRVEDSLALAEAAVGSGVAVEFAEYVRANDVPDPETMLANPDGYRPDNRPDVTFAAGKACLVAVQQRFTAKRLLALAKIIGQRIAKTGASPEVAVGLFADAVQLKQKHYDGKQMSDDDHQQFSILMQPLDKVKNLIEKG